MVKVTFVGIVKKIAKAPEEEKYTVIFQRQASFYKVDQAKTDSVDALHKSALNKLEVIVVNDATSLEILEARLSRQEE